MSRTVRFLGITAMVAGLVLGAFTSNAFAKPNAACKIVKAKDAAKIFGEPAQKKPESSPTSLGVACIYEAKDQKKGNLLQVRIYDGEQFFGKRIYPDAPTVNGLGRNSLVNTEGNRSVDVQFIKHGHTVAISYSDFEVASGDTSDADVKTPLVEALARKVAKKV